MSTCQKGEKERKKLAIEPNDKHIQQKLICLRNARFQYVTVYQESFNRCQLSLSCIKEIIKCNNVYLVAVRRNKKF